LLLSSKIGVSQKLWTITLNEGNSSGSNFKYDAIFIFDRWWHFFSAMAPLSIEGKTVKWLNTQTQNMQKYFNMSFSIVSNLLDNQWRNGRKMASYLNLAIRSLQYWAILRKCIRNQISEMRFQTCLPHCLAFTTWNKY
jgi:hypothetical protein